MSVLSLKNISYSYGANPVLDNLSYDFEAGHMYCIVGKSGAGKTTLLSILSGLAAPKQGSIFYKEQDIKSIDKYKFRSKYIGVIFQSFNLITKFTAMENVMLSMDIAGVKNSRKKETAIDLLMNVGLTEEEARRRVLKLSGGQQQRVAIARAIACRPPLILADEPTGNLDSRSGGEIMQILTALAGDGRTVIIITHDNSLAARCRRIIRIADGRVAADGPLAS